MEVRISVEKEFERQLRKLTKKYRSIIDDYETFLNELEKNPYQGSCLGRGVRKVRMAIARKKWWSKGYHLQPLPRRGGYCNRLADHIRQK